jgi:type I restriction-modification system DNA methylase subunit
MGGIERDRARVKSTGEVFTRDWMVRYGLDQIEQRDPDAFSNPSKTFVDPAAGDGAMLVEALIKKMENGSTFEQALQTIYGVDLMPDNVDLCRDRLLCGREDLRHIVEQNIVCADALRYHYRFDGTDPYETGQDQHFNSLFTIG